MNKNKQKNDAEAIPKFSQLKPLPKIKRENLSIFDIENDLTAMNNAANHDFKNKKCGYVSDFDNYLNVYNKIKAKFKKRKRFASDKKAKQHEEERKRHTLLTKAAAASALNLPTSGALNRNCRFKLEGSIVSMSIT
jgi:hypothetical protein